MTKKIDTTDARQGETHRGVRYMLIIGTTAAVVAMAVVVLLIR
ncbi:MAG TPA: hypothetical protein VK001_12210 [Geminicoccaceae bacterium]|nr:hypothetical protein [Geminicoccaceae bacterium]